MWMNSRIRVLQRQCSSAAKLFAQPNAWSVKESFLGVAQNVTMADMTRVAGLAKLDVSPQDAQGFLEDFQRTVFFMEQITKVDRRGVEPMYSPVEDVVSCPQADDVAAQDAVKADVLRNAAASHEGFFVVDKVIQQQQQGE
jgi:aspartyl-tRNA(Asn)/glutamyl-tRNA(Gln) amidotransferase subunit C